MDRQLAWDGCVNVRGLGGLCTRDGCEIRHGALVRADAVDRLTCAGWTALHEHGIRTVIDLRNDDEIQPDVAPRPGGLSTLRLPLDGIEDRRLWDQWMTGPQFGTPCYQRRCSIASRRVRPLSSQRSPAFGRAACSCTVPPAATAPA